MVGSPKGVKKGGVFEILERELEVECLPRDLPEKIEINVSELDIDQSIHAGDIEEKDSLKILTSHDTVIASVHIPRVSSIEEETPEGVEGDIQTDQSASSDE